MLPRNKPNTHGLVSYQTVGVNQREKRMQTLNFNGHSIKKPSSPRNRLLNVYELSQQLGVQLKTIYAWVNQKKIPYIKVGRLVKFDQKDIDGWIESRKVAPSKYWSE